MPLDEFGQRADLIMYGGAVINRMNLGAMLEQYINFVSYMIRKKTLELYKTEGYKQAWDYLLDYYNTVSPLMGSSIVEVINDEASIVNHLNEIERDRICIWKPIHCQLYGKKLVQVLRDKYQLFPKPVTYRGRSGNKESTAYPVLIGSCYILLLEKTGEDWSATASPKRNHFGVLGKLTNTDKYSKPSRDRPGRIAGEAEVRLFIATLGGKNTARFMSESNDPKIHKDMVRSLLTADKPTAIEDLYDPNKYSLGGSRALLYVKHILECAGIKLKRGVNRRVS